MNIRHFTFTDTGADRLRVALWIAGALAFGVGVNCLAALRVAAGLSLF
jgi:hypothetical protein